MPDMQQFVPVARGGAATSTAVRVALLVAGARAAAGPPPGFVETAATTPVSWDVLFAVCGDTAEAADRPRRLGAGLTVAFGAQGQRHWPAGALRLTLAEEARQSLPLLLQGWSRLLTDTGAVCVEPDDLRFALGEGGPAAVALAAADGAERSALAMGEVFASLGRQGYARGCARHAVVTVLAEETLPSAEFDRIFQAWRQWLHPQALPLLALRSPASRPGLLEIRALVLGGTD